MLVSRPIAGCNSRDGAASNEPHEAQDDRDKKVPMPRDCFEEFMAPAKDGDAEGLERDGHDLLVPTNARKKTRTINKFD
eukprot:6211987-Pleurochrysis_carterae.AAC.8